jgi:small nuclear ribonucleoprotein (snRNP)-like protein
MRKVLSLLLIFVLVLPVSPVSADDADMTTPDALTLRERLRNMPAEAARFLDRSPEFERMWLHGGGRNVETQDDREVARLRVRMRQLSPGAEITIVLRDGERIRGELAGTTVEDFTLNVPHRTRQSTHKLRKTFRYEEVESADLREANGWRAPEKIREIPIGKRIQLLLLDGARVDGRLESVSDTGFAMKVDRTLVRDYSLHDVASFRPAGMPGYVGVLIAVGVTLGVLALVTRFGGPS